MPRVKHSVLKEDQTGRERKGSHKTKDGLPMNIDEKFEKRHLRRERKEMSPDQQGVANINDYQSIV